MKIGKGQILILVELPDPLLVIHQGQTGYGERILLSQLGMTLRPGCRVGLLGRNGAGKSTLIKLLAGALPLLGGERKEAKALKIGYFAQHQLEQLRPEESPLWHVQHLEPETPEQALRARKYRDWETDRKSTRLNSSHSRASRMPSSA